ncbi:DMT family transporter [Kaarinaea lacus]
MGDHFKPSVAKTLVLTTLAMIAFAANSVLCRMALGNDTIDASSFTVLRLLSGALVLFLLISLRQKKRSADSSSLSRGSWLASSMLFLYAITFSFAYITLDTGTGALILFGTVQILMIVVSMIRGHRLHIAEWVGVIIAFVGFVYLVLPGVTSPSAMGFVLMTAAGIGWGVYTLKGKGSSAPLMDTTFNFIRTIPLVIVLFVVSMQGISYTTDGIILAILSGGLASGVGYTIWYSALGGLSAIQAAVVQLTVPVIAAFGGVIFMSEGITVRLMLASLMILGGILLVVLGRYYFVQLNAQSSSGSENR